ncbi:leucine rich adaptor protein 1-like isoform X1 [Ornithorhynchus anatinus]|uniref:leucine rich adaptor protein 1-like isoform X1 n=1 Tax=Ornithorhynchus anatinus TaxID=9258 RepID=UPI0004548D3E|nr:leucine rich adaptor protein 1-like isoform X1 [Ornithorhynchus anatinus]
MPRLKAVEGENICRSPYYCRDVVELLCIAKAPSAVLKSHGGPPSPRPGRHRAEAGTQSAREPGALSAGGRASNPGRGKGQGSGQQLPSLLFVLLCPSHRPCATLQLERIGEVGDQAAPPQAGDGIPQVTTTLGKEPILFDTFPRVTTTLQYILYCLMLCPRIRPTGPHCFGRALQVNLRATDVQLMRQLLIINESIESIKWVIEEKGTIMSRGSSLSGSLCSLLESQSTSIRGSCNSLQDYSDGLDGISVGSYLDTLADDVPGHQTPSDLDQFSDSSLIEDTQTKPKHPKVDSDYYCFG